MPVVESLSEEFAGRARFAKVHVDKEGVILNRFDASGIPAYILFHDGVEVDRLLPMPYWIEARIRRMLESELE